MKRERLWLRVIGVMAALGLVVVACGGSGFSSGDSSDDGAAGEAGQGATSGTSGSAGTSGTAGMGGTGGGGTTLCTDATECDDGIACTQDLCNELGACENPPKCGGDEPACCGGVCGQCCSATDCMDASDCTSDDCFNGFCVHTPTDCPDPTTQYCGETGCMDREECVGHDDCDDGKPCTEDRCDNGLCTHEGCAVGTFCCADGCAACCSDSQCAGESNDVCSPSRCIDGQCQNDDLCQAAGTQCCERPNGTADCGHEQCCTTAECPERECMRRLCTPTGCHYDPVPEECPPGEVCVVDVGCTPVSECSTDDQCPATNPCEQGRCQNGKCEFQSACSNGTVCCPGLGCRQCCSNTECQAGSDTGRPYCCPDGVCGQCCTAADCGGVVAEIITPDVNPTTPTGPGTTCNLYECTPDHLCRSGTTTICRTGTVCCPGLGCVPANQCPI